MQTPTFYCGVDWADRTHDVAVITKTGDVVARAQIPETPEGIKQLFDVLGGLRNSHTHGRRQVPIGIETNRGLLVQALRDRKQPIYQVSPTEVATYRQRISPRRKSDRGDAHIIALLLRDSWHRRRPQPCNSSQADAVAILVAAHRRTQHTRHRFQHQLRALLRQANPVAVTAWTHLPDGLRRGEARAVLAAAPTAAAAMKLNQHRIHRILVDAGRTRLAEGESYRLHGLFATPVLRLDRTVEAVMATEVHSVLDLFDQACRTEEDLLAQLTDAVADHPQAHIYQSFPGCGPLLSARLLAYLGDDPSRFTDVRGMRAYAGLAPLTWESGASRSVTHRRVCNRYLKSACHQWAFSSLTRSTGCRALYDARRGAGDSYGGALRRVASKLLSCLYGCLLTDSVFREDIAFPAH